MRHRLQTFQMIPTSLVLNLRCSLSSVARNLYRRRCSLYGSGSEAEVKPRSEGLGSREAINYLEYLEMVGAVGYVLAM